VRELFQRLVERATARAEREHADHLAQLRTTRAERGTRSRARIDELRRSPTWPRKFPR
jgi:hypothetical protein